MRRLLLGSITLLLTPFLALLAAVLLLLNLIDRLAKRGRQPATFRDLPPDPLASIIVLNWNGKDLLAQGIPSVIEAVVRDARPHEILVVDNGSTDGSVEYLRQTYPQIRVIDLPENLGFAGGNNAGVRAAQHDVVVLLNNDMVVDPGFLRPLLDNFGPRTFAVSSNIYLQDASVRREETGRTSATFRRGWIDYAHLEVDAKTLSRPCYPVFYAGGGSSAFHRERFLALGGFQDLYSPAYVEDTDLGFRAWKAGWEVLFTPGSIVHHRHRASTSRRFTDVDLQILIHRNQLLFIWKNLQSWPMLLAHCAFLPWNSYRFTRDHGLQLWLSLVQAARRIPALIRSRSRSWRPEMRTDSEVFCLLDKPALYFTGKRRLSGTRGTSREKARHVLWMTAYLPHLGRHAGAGRMYHLLKRMAQRYRISLLAFIESEEEKELLPELEAMCEKVVVMKRNAPRRLQLFPYEPFDEFLTPAMTQAMQDCLSEQDFDLIQLEYTQMACYADKALGIPTLLTKHEVDFAACARRARVESTLFRKLRWFYNYLQVLDREAALQRRVDAAICMTDCDKGILERFCTSVPVHVINTGVDLDYFVPPTRPPVLPRLVFVGAFRHHPNVDAMVYFCNKVLPLIQKEVPETELFIVGSHPTTDLMALQELRGVRVTGFVPDVRPLMAESSVYVVPLRLGVGIRGKILEAWGMAMPVVATSVACAGLRCRDGESLMVANTPNDFADHVISLLKDPERRGRIGRAGRDLAERFYSWEAAADHLDRLYRLYMEMEGPNREAALKETA